jgi:hypothetical protein
MAQQVVTELVIDSDTSGADRFSQSMDKAGSSAERGASSVQSMSLAIAGVSVASVAALAALRGFVDYVGGQSQALVDMADHAKLAGYNLREFQETLFAARAKGLTEKDFVSGLDKIGADLIAASRGVTEFGNLFEKNGLSIRKANGELKTAKDGVADLAGLMQNATPQIQQAIAKIAGVSAAWVPFLKQGVDGIEALKKSAAGLGVIIDDDVVNKAKDFNDQWKIAVAAWDLQFKASLAGILPMLVKLANMASTVLDAAGRAGNFFSRALTPQEDWSTGDLTKQLAGLEEYRGKLAAVNEQMSFFQRQQAIGRSGAIGVTADADLKSIDAEIAKVKELIEQKKALKRVEVTGDGSTVLPPSATEKNDAVDRAILSLSRHTEAQKADAAAMGSGARAHAELRAEAALTSAIQANNGKITQEQANTFIWLKLAAGGAAESLERARVASAIKFNKDTIGLSPESVQIAQQLKGLYPDVATALASIEAQAMRVNNVMKDISDGFRDVGKSMFSAFLSGGNMMEAMVASLDKLAAKLADKAFENLLEGVMTGNPVQMGIGAAQAGASALISMFTGDQKAKKELEEAKKQWEGMAGQVNAFNAAAAGVDLGPLTSELNSLFSSFRTLAHAAAEARDEEGRTRVGNTLYKGAMRVISEFERGTDTLNPLQQSIKAVNDEAAGLKDTLAEISAANHWSFDTSGIDAAVKVKIQNLIKNAMDTLTDSLTARLNAANGQGYLNDATALAKRRQQDLSDAAILGNDPALLAQISAVFHAEAQKIVNDAGLVGAEFADFTALFPDFAGVVTESADALAAASDRFKAMTETINDYLDSLQLGDKSILNPQEQLKAAQSQFNAQLALAQSGNADAMGTITQYASALLDQAKGFYASSAGYGDVYSAVTEALRGLTGGQGVIADTGAAMLQQPSLLGPQVQSNAGLAVMQPTASRVTASNDNGQYFANLGQQLVQAMAGCSMGEITAMREENEKLRAEVRNLVTAVEGNRPRAPRPSARTGTGG